MAITRQLSYITAAKLHNSTKHIKQTSNNACIQTELVELIKGNGHAKF